VVENESRELQKYSNRRRSVRRGLAIGEYSAVGVWGVRMRRAIVESRRERSETKRKCKGEKREAEESKDEEEREREANR